MIVLFNIQFSFRTTMIMILYTVATDVIRFTISRNDYKCAGINFGAYALCWYNKNMEFFVSKTGLTRNVNSPSYVTI